MTCHSCAEKAKRANAARKAEHAAAQKITKFEQSKRIPNDMKEDDMLYAPKSADPSKKVKLVYNGGGHTRKKSVGCTTCHGGKASYSVTTSETIIFVSEDCNNNIYKETFSVGHSYYVTEEQAKVLLSLTYVSHSGKTAHKFTKGE